MKKSNKKVLIVAAHPDDEVLGCGGTIARLTDEGHDVYIAILSGGVTSRFKKSEEVSSELVKELQKKSHQASEILGTKELYMYSLPDNLFDTVPLLDIVKIIEELIKKLKPSVIYTHYGGDLNIDHVITHRAVLTSTRPIRGHPVKELYAFEVPSSTEWSLGQFQTAFSPNVFVDIHDKLNVKIKAMEIYESESRSFPHPRSSKALKALAHFRGSTAGFDAAEGFQLVRKLN